MDCCDALPRTDSELQRRLDESETDRGPDDASHIKTCIDQLRVHLTFQDRLNQRAPGLLLSVQHCQFTTRLGLRSRAILKRKRDDLTKFILQLLDPLPPLHVGAYQFDLFVFAESVQPVLFSRSKHLDKRA